MAHVHARLGQLDEAFERLAWLLATPNIAFTPAVLETSPFYDPLRADPRYEPLVQRYR